MRCQLGSYAMPQFAAKEVTILADLRRRQFEGATLNSTGWYEGGLREMGPIGEGGLRRVSVCRR